MLINSLIDHNSNILENQDESVIQDKGTVKEHLHSQLTMKRVDDGKKEEVGFRVELNLSIDHK